MKITITQWLTLFMLIISLNQAQAQWVSKGPDGGFINGLCQSGDQLYALTGSYFSSSSLYRSDDNGQHWIKVVSESLPFSYISALTARGNSIFISSDGLYRSDDQGTTWQKVYHSGVQHLAANATAIFGTSQGSGILCSYDNGQSWILSNNGITDNWFYSLLALDSAIFAGTGDNYAGIFRSDDNGNTWHQITNGMAYYQNGVWLNQYAPPIISMAMAGDILLAGTSENQGLWKSDDLGDHWTFTSMETMNYSDITAIAGNDQVIIAGSRNGGGLFRSFDGGNQWMEANSGIDNYGQITSLLPGEGTFMAGGKGGLYLTNNDGMSWTQKCSGIRAQHVTYPGFVTHKDQIYVGTAYGGVFASPDNGETWSDVNNNLPVDEWNLNDLYANPSALFAWDRLSFDGGATWEMSNIYSPGTIEYGFIGPRWLEFKGAWYAFKTGTNAGVFRSTDQGQSWSTIINGLPAVQDLGFFNLHANTNTLFLGTSQGMFYSTDEGDSWKQGTFPDLNIFTLSYAKFITIDNYELCGLKGGGGSRGMYRSADNGATWLRVGEMLVHKIINNGEITYASGTNLEQVNGEWIEVPRIFRSDDQGEHWTIISGNLSDILTLSLEGDGSRIYISKVANNDNHEYCSVDMGDTWVDISDGMDKKVVVSSFYVYNGYLFANTNGQSVWRRPLSDFEVPAQPGSISGMAFPCNASIQTYQVEPVSGITYTWQVPTGWEILSGNGSHQIEVLTGSQSGLVLVIPSNGFGVGSSQYLSVEPVETVEPLVSISTDDLTVCSGHLITVESQVSHGGIDPLYQWYVNGTEMPETGSSLTYMPENNDHINLLVTSDITCSFPNPAVSNTLMIAVAASPEVSWETFAYDTLCINYTPVSLSGGFPGGGEYTGDGIVQQSFDPSLAGVGVHTLTYTYTNETGCAAEASRQVVVNTCSGIPENTSTLKLWPNPAHDKLTIEWDLAPEVMDIYINDLWGATVLHQQGSPLANRFTLSLDGLKRGNYLIKLITKEQIVVRQIMIH